MYITIVYFSDERTSLIVVIIDTNPVWWGMKADVSPLIIAHLTINNILTYYYCRIALVACCA